MSELEKQKIMIDRSKDKANIGDVYTCSAVIKQQRKFEFKALKNLKLNDISLEEVEVIALRLEEANLINRVINLEEKITELQEKLLRLTSVEL